MKQPTSMLKCRWCGFTVAAWTTNKSGERKSGWPKLEDHQATEHEDQFFEGLDKVDEHMKGKS